MVFYFSVPPCEEAEKGSCAHVCTNEGEEAVCSCNENYKLAEDKKNCEKGAYYSCYSENLFPFNMTGLTSTYLPRIPLVIKWVVFFARQCKGFGVHYSILLPGTSILL